MQDYTSFIIDFLVWFDLTGVFVFAVSGALRGVRHSMDVFGVIFLAVVTGLGGGTIRDILLGVTPVFWVRTPLYLGVAVLGGLIAFTIAPYLTSRRRALIWADAAGLSLFCVLGTETALQAGAAPGVAIVMGMITSVCGGITRDILCAETPLIFRQEIYALVALFGGGLYVLLPLLGFSDNSATILAILAAFFLRAAALVFNLSIPPRRH